jgi:ATP-dependent DNA helicase RecQ
MQSLPFKERRTLQLVEAFEFEAFSTGLSAQGGYKWSGSFVSHFGERLTARITDPALTEKLERGYIPGTHCMVTASLSMPFKREGWQSDEDPCWKLIAGIVELEPGTWPEVKPGVTDDKKASPMKVSGPQIDETSLVKALKEVFGFDGFMPNQKQIIQAILNGRDCIAVMPTGGGKSLCYQFPANLMSGTCMVISPLISLMKDQVDTAVLTGLQAACFTSAQTEQERVRIFRRLRAGELDLLYVSPERFAMETFLNNLKRVPLCLIAIDEAHCISEWGHDFRPDYLYLSEIVKHFPEVPVAAFTATATHRVAQDIIRQLSLRSPHSVRASFDRPNLFYEVVPKNNVETQIIDFVRARKGQAGIVYRTTRNSVDTTVATLADSGIDALPYHAGLDDTIRQHNQEAFNHDEVDVVVATIAFGMGIDKPNISFIVHGDLPRNMEAYYQETGRAGRDGEPAHCVLFFGRGDIWKIRFFIDQVENRTEQDRLRASLNEMALYSGSTAKCRRRKILAYFGEEFTKNNCGACDICTGSMEQIDITREARMLLSAIVRTGQYFGASHIVDIVCGANTKKIRSLGHDSMPTYGVGKGLTKRLWRQILDELLTEDIIIQTGGKYPVLKLTDAAFAVLKGRKTQTVQRLKEAPQPQTVKQEEKGDPDLFERLRQLRYRLAHEHNVPPYVIFPDRTLQEMVRKKPVSEDTMRTINGIGETKLAAYCGAFIQEIASYAGRQPPEKDSAPAVVSYNAPSQNRNLCSQTVEATWGLLQQKLDVNEIALQRRLSERTVTDHVERLILDGRDVDIDRFVPPDVRCHIERIFPQLKTRLLREIVDTATIPVTFEQAKLARAWICSGKV